MNLSSSEAIELGAASSEADTVFGMGGKHSGGITDLLIAILNLVSKQGQQVRHETDVNWHGRCTVVAWLAFDLILFTEKCRSIEACTGKSPPKEIHSLGLMLRALEKRCVAILDTGTDPAGNSPQEYEEYFLSAAKPAQNVVQAVDHYDFEAGRQVFRAAQEPATPVTREEMTRRLGCCGGAMEGFVQWWINSSQCPPGWLCLRQDASQGTPT
jgi:hypothetical protein